MVCTTKGTLDEHRTPVGSGALLQWQTSFSGTCIGPAGVQAISGGGQSYTFLDTAPQCALVDQSGIPRTIALTVRFVIGTDIVWQYWVLGSRYSGPFAIQSIVLTPHPTPQGDVAGVGAVATRLAGKCPGDPAASYTFAFVH
jgi:hypothetical protein